MNAPMNREVDDQVAIAEQESAQANEQADAYDQATKSLPWYPPDQARQADLDELEAMATQGVIAQKLGLRP